jgi:hypothetical protein
LSVPPLNRSGAALSRALPDYRQWQLYHQAQTAYHALEYQAGELTEISDDNHGYKKVAGVIDEALAGLAGYLGGLPYTVTVDGCAIPRLWEGLHNNKQGQQGKPGTTWLPGHTFPLHDRPIAVIRVNKADDEVLRPLRVSYADLQDNVPGTNGTAKVTNGTAKVLYRLDSDCGEPAWYLVTVPPSTTVPDQADSATRERAGPLTTDLLSKASGASTRCGTPGMP